MDLQRCTGATTRTEKAGNRDLSGHPLRNERVAVVFLGFVRAQDREEGLETRKAGRGRADGRSGLDHLLHYRNGLGRPLVGLQGDGGR
jgi:hypothetical protein